MNTLSVFSLLALRRCLACAAFAVLLLSVAQAETLLNVSYDPTRELYRELNADFLAKRQKAGKSPVEIRQSHGPSGKQALSVRNGLQADVVTLAMSYDIDRLAQTGLLPADWQKRLPHNSSPYTSVIVFLVRDGNPKKIKDWDDFIRPDVQVLTPNPKISGAARWSYITAWHWAMSQAGGSENSARQFVTKMYRNVPVLDSGVRAAVSTFTELGLGDALITWENEAHLAKKSSKEPLTIVYPKQSILAEPAVAWVDQVVDNNGKRELAESYLRYLYTPDAQKIIARHHYRPFAITPELEKQFPALPLVTIDELGGWDAIHKKHFADGGVFDQIYQPAK